ncbi:MAG: TIGR02270 family protein [Chromatiales bacterium]|jgi:uncharacterized protein (TIGR02270 family)
MIIEDIVSQHAEEAAFLWLLRDNAMRAPHYDLKDLMDLEERVEAHLDGLRVAGAEAWPFCEQGLEYQESGEVFAAGYFALDSANQDWLAAVLDVVTEEPETSRGMISALGWVEREKLQGQVVEWLKADKPLLRELGLGACSVQRVDCGKYLIQAIEDDEAMVRSRALRSVGELHRQDLLQTVLEHLSDDEEACRYQAARSATLFRDPRGLRALCEFVEAPGHFREAALGLALRAMDMRSAMQWVRELTQQPDTTRLVVQGTGIIGDPVAVPWLMGKMRQPEFARVAGEALSLITGVDLAYDDLEGDWPEGFEAGPAENPEDDDVAMDADEDLPWPDVEKIDKWWLQNQARFPQGNRLICGQPISPQACYDVLKNGFQRQRRAAALELALLNPNEPLFNTSAPAKRQMRKLGVV